MIRQNEYLWSKGLKLKAYRLFEDSDADLFWLLFYRSQLVQLTSVNSLEISPTFLRYRGNWVMRHNC